MFPFLSFSAWNERKKISKMKLKSERIKGAKILSHYLNGEFINTFSLHFMLGLNAGCLKMIQWLVILHDNGLWWLILNRLQQTRFLAKPCFFGFLFWEKQFFFLNYDYFIKKIIYVSTYLKYLVLCPQVYLILTT